MKVNGTATLNAPADRVWAALNDPAVLVRTIPGCEQLEAVGPDSYRMTITAGVASIKGTYLGDVQLADPQPPNAFTLKASGAGAPGTVNADVRVTLTDRGDGTTLLSYAADAVVGGPVGGVGQRVLSGVAKRTAGEFFQAVDGVLNGAGAPESSPAVAGPAVAGPAVAGPAVAGPAVAGPAVAVAARGAEPALYRRPSAAASGVAGGAHLDLRQQLAAVGIGAAIALAGVWLGWRIARRG
jgi:uncharacterized protein